MTFGLVSVWHEITDLPSVYQVTLGIGIAILLIAAVWGSLKALYWWRIGRHISKARYRQIEQDSYALHSELQDQAENLGRVLRIIDSYVVMEGLDDSDSPWIEYVFVFHNESLYRISLSDQPDGYVEYGDKQLVQPPIILDPLPIRCGRNEDVIIGIRQPLIPTVARTMKNQDALFNFSRVSFWINATPLGGYADVRLRLPIPNSWHPDWDAARR